jgi:hypothetical protein
MVDFAPPAPAPDAPARRIVDLRPAAPAWLHPLLFLFWMGLGCAWWFTFSGPYRWLAEWQLSLMDAHYPAVTASIPIALGWIASDFTISRMLGTRMLGRDESPLRALAGLKRLAPVAILAVGGVVGARWNRQIVDAGALLAATPADLAAHADRAGLYLALTGVADPRMAVTRGDVYFPLRQAGEEPDAPAVAVVAMREKEMLQLVEQNPDATVTAHGMAARDMDASMRRFFEQQGVRLAADPWVVRTWHTPDSMRTGLWFILGMTIVMAAAVAVVQVLEARKAASARGG